MTLRLDAAISACEKAGEVGPALSLLREGQQMRLQASAFDLVVSENEDLKSQLGDAALFPSLSDFAIFLGTPF